MSIPLNTLSKDAAVEITRKAKERLDGETINSLLAKIFDTIEESADMGIYITSMYYHNGDEQYHKAISKRLIELGYKVKFSPAEFSDYAEDFDAPPCISISWDK